MPLLRSGLIMILKNRETLMDSFCGHPSVQAAAYVHLSLIQQMAGCAGNMCPRVLVHRSQSDTYTLC